MKQKLFCFLFLLLVTVLAVSCGGEGQVTTVSSTGETAGSFPTDSTTGDGETETTTAEITEADTTYEEILYNTEPIVGTEGEPLLIHWNPYLLSPLMSEEAEVQKGAEAVIKAILNRRLTVKFQSAEVMKTVCDNLFYEFPLTALTTLLPDEDTLTLKIDYRLDREEHLAAVQAFGNKVEEIVADTLCFGDEEAVKAIGLYHAVSFTVDYMHVDYKAWQTGAYNALMEGMSICYGFADAYRYLLTQVGVEAYIVRGYRATDRAAHAWTWAKLDGEFYHFDPTWESSMLDGVGLYYFGQTDSRRNSTLVMDDVTVGYGSLARKLPLIAKSERFQEINGDKFRNENWVIDREKQVILYQNKEYPFKAEP